MQSILTELHIFVSWFAVCFGFRWEHLPSLNWARLCRAALCDPRRAIGGMAGKAATEQFLGEIVWNNWVGGIDGVEWVRTYENTCKLSKLE